MFEKGESVTFNHEIGVVVFMGKDLGEDMDDHTGVWFGTIKDGKPEISAVPTEYVRPGPPPELKH